MTHDEFFTALKQGEIARAYLFQGEEEHIKAKALEALRKKLLTQGFEALNETLLTNPPADDIIAAAETLPLMAERRLVVVRDSTLLSFGKAAAEEAEITKLAAYLERLPEFTCLVFYCRGLPDGRKKLTQALSKKACVVRFDPLADAALARWIRAQLRPLGKDISPENAAFLSFTAGRELLTLSQELSKLTAYLGERGEITRTDIETVVTPSLECTVFQLVDALIAGKEAEAFGRLRIMLENGEARIGILAMITRQYRNLLYVTLMQQEKLPEPEMQKRLGVQSFALRVLIRQARAFTSDTLRARLDLCVDTDYAIKSGRMREDAALERVIFLLC